MNLFEQQAANRRRTWMVMVVFCLFLGVMGAGFDLFVIGGGGSYVPLATFGALGLGFVSAWGSYYMGDRAVLASSSAVPIETLLGSGGDAVQGVDGALGASTDDDRLRYTQFKNIVDEMAIAAGIPAPKAYVIPDDDPNAFATGRDPAHASIAVTRGLLRSLNREELQGVVAHEMGHIRNLDIRLMLIIAALVGGVVLLADWSGRAMRFGAFSGRGSSRRSSSSSSSSSGAAGLILFAIWIVAVILAPIVARLLALAVSRAREYQADASGAELTRNPLGLASALKKIDAATAPTTSIKRGTAHLCIADPEEHPASEREGRLAGWFATHPPMDKRIAALEAMAYTSSAIQPPPRLV